jgi:antitoxin HicB
MMKYFAKLSRQRDGSYLVEFRDLPGCLTEGSNKVLALQNASEALNGWLAAHCDRALDVPEPRAYRGAFYEPIEVDTQIEFALKLRRLRLKKKLSQQEVATRLGISQQAYAKLERPESSNPSLMTIAKLSKVLEAEIEIRLVA